MLHNIKKEQLKYDAAYAFITKVEQEDPARYQSICSHVKAMNTTSKRKVIKYLNKLEEQEQFNSFSKTTQNVITIVGFIVALVPILFIAGCVAALSA